VENVPVKVLIAEDNGMNMELVKDILTLNGYVTVGARTGAEAIRLVAMEKPDIVLMDLHMPGMDGMTAMRILKSDVAYGEIPVLALTAAAGRAETEDMLARGFDGCVVKPINKEVLLNEIRFFTAKKGAP